MCQADPRFIDLIVWRGGKSGSSPETLSIKAGYSSSMLKSMLSKRKQFVPRMDSFDQTVESHLRPDGVPLPRITLGAVDRDGKYHERKVPLHT